MESPGSTQRSSRGIRMPFPQDIWHSSRPSHLASRSKIWAVSWPAWTPTISVSLPCCGMPAVAAGRHVLTQETLQRVLVMTDGFVRRLIPSVKSSSCTRVRMRESIESALIKASRRAQCRPCPCTLPSMSISRPPGQALGRCCCQRGGGVGDRLRPAPRPRVTAGCRRLPCCRRRCSTGLLGRSPARDVLREVPIGMDYIVVDCSAEHQDEVMSRGTLGGSKEWPGDAALWDAGADKCLSAFASYVGLDPDESRLDFDFLTPDKGSWNDGKGTLICFVLDPSHDQITRALRDAHE
jgi:hypothetical protein